MIRHFALALCATGLLSSCSAVFNTPDKKSNDKTYNGNSLKKNALVEDGAVDEGKGKDECYKKNAYGDPAPGKGQTDPGKVPSQNQNPSQNPAPTDSGKLPLPPSDSGKGEESSDEIVTQPSDAPDCGSSEEESSDESAEA